MLAIGTTMSGMDLSTILNARLLFYFAVFFSLGYVLYSVLFAVVAVTCTSTEELGQSMLAAMLPMVVALMAAISVISGPRASGRGPRALLVRRLRAASNPVCRRRRRHECSA